MRYLHAALCIRTEDVLPTISMKSIMRRKSSVLSTGGFLLDHNFGSEQILHFATFLLLMITVSFPWQCIRLVCSSDVPYSLWLDVYTVADFIIIRITLFTVTKMCLSFGPAGSLNIGELVRLRCRIQSGRGGRGMTRG